MFKRFADYYLKKAVHLRKRDISIDDELKLLGRNIQKRLFIGIGCELLLKALYLKNGFNINLVKDKKSNMKDFPFLLQEIDRNDFYQDNTHTIYDLIEHLPKVRKFKQISRIRNGLRIAKVFRNKEGHVVLERHDFDRSNYTEIEKAIAELYREGFREDLSIRFSLKPNEKSLWKISSPNHRFQPTRKPRG